MVNNYNQNIVKSLILSLISTFLLEFYVEGVENASYLFANNYFEIFGFFSIKHIIFFFVLFFIIYSLLLNEEIRNKIFEQSYEHRFLIGALIIVICVIFELHGSSIAQLNISNMTHHPLFGISRGIRSDEFNVNTMFAFSQYYNNFSYFSSIPRAAPTDMFIVYGQAIWDLLTIYRPFLIGYLFLSPAKGLSFFWISRLVCLFLVSFEMGMLISDNKKLSLAYAILFSFSPFIHWWFAINGLVEMLIFGQLFVLLLNYYMLTKSYKKRLIIAIFLIISAGGFALALYPAWEIPLAYVFLILSIWIINKNKDEFQYCKKDLALIGLFILTLALTAYYIYTKSFDTIITIINTAYPGSRIYVGDGNPLFLFDYIGNMFYPLLNQETSTFTVNYSFIYTFFPMGIILFCIVQFYQKKKDLLLYLLMAIYILFICYYSVAFPESIAKLTLLSKSFNERLLQVAIFVELLILIRSMSLLEKINLKKNYIMIISVAIAILSVFTLNYNHPNRFQILMLIGGFVILATSIYFILNIDSNKAKNGFLICIIVISACSVGLVNPIESGCDVYFEQPIIKEVQSIVHENPQDKWVVEGNIFVDEIIGVGAPTLNSVNTYPNLELWEQFDENNQSRDIYNRYAHIPTVLIDDNKTHFEYQDDPIFILYLNVNDLEKLNISYILTKNDMEHFSSENMTFIKEYEDNNLNKIYKIEYKN